MKTIFCFMGVVLLLTLSARSQPNFIADLYPAQNALNVPADVELRVAFVKPLDPASICDSCIYIYSDITGLHKWEWELEENGTELTLRPKHYWGVGDAPFNAGERVTTTLTTRLRYMNGEPFEGLTWFYTVAVRQNYGGHFYPIATFGSNVLNRFYIADFNGDRAPDLAVHDTFKDQVAVFLNDGKGRFVFSHMNSGWGASGGTQSLDFDWNGGIDLAIGMHIVQFNDGRANFDGREIIPPWLEGYRVYDFNNDGLFDAVSNVPGRKHGIRIAFSTEAEAFVDTQTVATLFRPLYNRQIELYDLDNDGKRDIIAPAENWYGDDAFVGFATIKMNNETPLEIFQNENNGVHTYLAYANDFNGDNYIDYAFFGGHTNPFRPYYLTHLNDGNGFLKPGGVYIDTVKAYEGGAGGDIDGDGDIDFFLKSSYYYSVMPELVRNRYTIAINQGGGIFDVQEERKLPYDSTAFGYGNQARLVDLDLDDDLDIIIEGPGILMVIANEEYRTKTTVHDPFFSELKQTSPFVAIYPNPFNSSTKISFDGSLKTVNVYNILGRRVRSWHSFEVSRGESQILWDGVDDNGQFVTSGIYLVRLIFDDKIITKKVAFLR